VKKPIVCRHLFVWLFELSINFKYNENSEKYVLQIQSWSIGFNLLWTKNIRFVCTVDMILNEINWDLPIKINQMQNPNQVSLLAAVDENIISLFLSPLLDLAHSKVASLFPLFFHGSWINWPKKLYLSVRNDSGNLLFTP
jgi:hypothetical protein